jgi:hypothetical protein
MSIKDIIQKKRTHISQFGKAKNWLKNVLWQFLELRQYIGCKI